MVTDRVQDYGQHWREAERVQDYVQRTDQREAERAHVLKLMADLAPFDRSHPVRILDIGSGHGPIAAAILDAFPNGKAVGLDMSDAMMDVGRERMARFGNRFTYHVGDFAHGLPADLQGSFDIAVASASIHHLPPEDKRVLYRSIFEKLAPGGCFFNLDTMNPADDFLRQRYRAVRDLNRDPQAEDRPRAANQHSTSFAHYMDPVEDHLALLSAAGFNPVDCFYKHLSRALVGGFKTS